MSIEQLLVLIIERLDRISKQLDEIAELRRRLEHLEGQ